MNFYENGVGDSNYDESSPINGIKRKLTYQQCIDIYIGWALGRDVTILLPNAQPM